MREFRVGSVGELRCFPVKSMLGRPLEEAVFNSRGMRNDRLWAVRGAAGKLGSGKAARRFQRISTLPFVTAYCEGGPDGAEGSDDSGGSGDEVWFSLPGGGALRGTQPDIDARLSQVLGEPVTLHREGEEPHFDDSPVHLATQAEVERVERASGVAIDQHRLRANILVAPGPEGAAAPPEKDWPGHLVLLGPEVVLAVIEPMERCVMLSQATALVPADNRVLKAVAAHNDMNLGLCARVVRPGRVRVGDEVRLRMVPPTAGGAGA